VFDGNKAQLFKDIDTQQDAFRKDHMIRLLKNIETALDWGSRRCNLIFKFNPYLMLLKIGECICKDRGNITPNKQEVLRITYIPLI
jgi:hypothetical protein